MYLLCYGIQRSAREKGRPDINIFADSNYKTVRDSLDSEMKRLTSIGVGVVRKQAEKFSGADELLLWDKGLLDDSSPKLLLHSLVFLMGKKFSPKKRKRTPFIKVSASMTSSW